MLSSAACLMPNLLRHRYGSLIIIGDVLRSRLVAVNHYFDALCGIDVMSAVRAVHVHNEVLANPECDVIACPWLNENVHHLLVTRLSRLGHFTLRSLLTKIRPDCVGVVSGRLNARYARALLPFMLSHSFSVSR